MDSEEHALLEDFAMVDELDRLRDREKEVKDERGKRQCEKQVLKRYLTCDRCDPGLYHGTSFSPRGRELLECRNPRDLQWAVGRILRVEKRLMRIEEELKAVRGEVTAIESTLGFTFVAPGDPEPSWH